MPKTITPPRFAMLPALALACLALSACGGSSTSTTAASNTTTATSEATTGSATKVSGTATTKTSTSLSFSHTKAPASAKNKPTPPQYIPYKAALSAYAGCMRHHGVQISPPVTSPTGLPVLGTPKNTSTTSHKFSEALLQCRPYVIKITQVAPGGRL